MPKLFRIGLAATGLAAAAAAAGFKAGVTYTNKQLFEEDVVLPKKPAKDFTASSVLVQEIVKEVKDKQGAVDEKHLAKKVESMMRSLTMDKQLAQKIAQEKVERAEQTAKEAAEKVAKQAAENKKNEELRARLQLDKIDQLRKESDERDLAAQKVAEEEKKQRQREWEREWAMELEERARIAEYCTIDRFT